MASARGHDKQGALSSPWIIAIGLFAIGLLPRLIGLGDHPPRTDELFHIIAGRSWAANGTLAMGDGVYDRASLYSVATGVMFKIFGVGIFQGRLLGALAGALQVMALGLWVRSVADARAGWVAGLLLAFNHFAVEHAQSARFYAMHALATWVFAIAVYAMVTRGLAQGWARLAGLGLVAVASLALAAHLQKMTPVIVAAVGSWAGIWLLMEGKLGFFFGSTRRTAITLLIGGGAVLAVAVLAWQPLSAEWEFYRRAPGWAEGDRNNKSYYVQELSYGLNWIFSLFPVAAMIAWRRYRSAVSFCVVVIVVALAAHSFGGMKARRFAFYIYPFMLALWAFAFAVAAPTVMRWWKDVSAGWSRGRSTLAAIGVFGFAAAVALLCANNYRNSLVALSRLIKTGSPDISFNDGWARMEVDWTPYLADIHRLTKDKSVFIATDMTRSIYYLGDYDVLLNRSDLDDMGEGDFVFDYRTGRYDIGSGSALKLLMRCYPTGAVLVASFGDDAGIIPPDAWQVIRDDMREIALPAPLQMRAYEWRSTPDSGSEACKAVYDGGYVPAREGQPS